MGPVEAGDVFTPGELLKIALAGCAGMSADHSLARRLGPDVTVTVRVAGPNRDERYPALHEEILVDLSSLDEADRERVLTVVRRAIDRNCTVGRTLESGADVSPCTISARRAADDSRPIPPGDSPDRRSRTPRPPPGRPTAGAPGCTSSPARAAPARPPSPPRWPWRWPRTAAGCCWSRWRSGRASPGCSTSRRCPTRNARWPSPPAAARCGRCAVDVEAALLEYFEMFYNLGFAGRSLKKMGAVEFATTLAPGLRDVLLTGKVKETVTRTRHGQPAGLRRRRDGRAADRPGRHLPRRHRGDGRPGQTRADPQPGGGRGAAAALPRHDRAPGHAARGHAGHRDPGGDRAPAGDRPAGRARSSSTPPPSPGCRPTRSSRRPAGELDTTHAGRRPEDGGHHASTRSCSTDWRRRRRSTPSGCWTRPTAARSSPRPACRCCRCPGWSTAPTSAASTNWPTVSPSRGFDERASASEPWPLPAIREERAESRHERAQASRLTIWTWRRCWPIRAPRSWSPAAPAGSARPRPRPRWRCGPPTPGARWRC